MTATLKINSGFSVAKFIIAYVKMRCLIHAPHFYICYYMKSAVYLLVACLHLPYAKFCGGKVAGDAS